MASSAPRYARAFAEVAESDRLDPPAVQEQLRDFADTLAGSHDLREFLENPSIEMAPKLKVLEAIARRLGMYQQVRNFIAVIVEHRRLPELGDILTEYRELANARAGIAEVKVTTARPLNKEDRAQLEAQIGTLVQGRVRATYSEDPQLLGGAVVEVGSTIYDGSLRGQLDQLRQKLINA